MMQWFTDCLLWVGGVTSNKNSSVSFEKCFIFLLFACVTLIDLISTAYHYHVELHSFG